MDVGSLASTVCELREDNAAAPLWRTALPTEPVRVPPISQHKHYVCHALGMMPVFARDHSCFPSSYDEEVAFFLLAVNKHSTLSLAIAGL